MSQPIGYGIDFGTTNSAIAVAYPDHVEVLPLENLVPQTQLPSIAYLHRDGISAAGSQAVQAYLVNGNKKTNCSNCTLVDHTLMVSDCRQYRRGGRCIDARIMSGLKEFMTDGFESTHSWAKDFTMPHLVSVILSRLKREADRATNSNTGRVVLGHPVAFPGAQGPGFEKRQNLATDRLEEAARLAGFDEFGLCPEPAAALINEELETGTVLALDFGGGTFDAAIVRYSPEGGTVVALQGADVGGEIFNGELFEMKVASAIGLSRATVPAYIRLQLQTMAGARFLMSDGNFWGIAQEVPFVREVFSGGHVFTFYRAIEDAKIRLSSEHETTISFHRPDLDLEIPVARVELEQRIAPHIELVKRVIEKTLAQAGETPASIDSVIRTGGTSSLPAFVSMVTEMFGKERVEARDPFDSVAHGLGMQARILWAS